MHAKDRRGNRDRFRQITLGSGRYTGEGKKDTHSLHRYRLEIETHTHTHIRAGRERERWNEKGREKPTRKDKVITEERYQGYKRSSNPTLSPVLTHR